jgi:hypothetical protein
MVRRRTRRRQGPVEVLALPRRIFPMDTLRQQSVEKAEKVRRRARARKSA